MGISWDKHGDFAGCRNPTWIQIQILDVNILCFNLVEISCHCLYPF